MHVPCDGAHHAEPVSAVLKDQLLLDMQFDPANQMIEDVCTLANAPGRNASLAEAARTGGRRRLLDALAQVEFVHPMGHDPTAQHHLPKSRPLLLEERDRL